MPSLQLNLKVMLERKGSRATVETPAKRPRGRPPGPPKLRKEDFDDPALEAFRAMHDDHQAYYHELKPETPRMRRAGSGEFGDRFSMES